MQLQHFGLFCLFTRINCTSLKVLILTPGQRFLFLQKLWAELRSCSYSCTLLSGRGRKCALGEASTPWKPPGLPLAFSFVLLVLFFMHAHTSQSRANSFQMSLIHQHLWSQQMEDVTIYLSYNIVLFFSFQRQLVLNLLEPGHQAMPVVPWWLCRNA